VARVNILQQVRTHKGWRNAGVPRKLDGRIKWPARGRYPATKIEKRPCPEPPTVLKDCPSGTVAMIKPTAYMVLLLFSMSAFAAIAIRSGGSEKKKRGQKIAMVGCVVEKDGHMMLTDEEHPAGIVLMSSGDIDIKAHVGQMIRVTGIMITMGDEGTVKVEHDKAQTGKMMGIKLKSMKMIKGSCDQSMLR